MIQIFFSISILFASIQLHAKCFSHDLSVFPESKEIDQNSIIMLIGYGYDQPLIDSLCLGYTVFLVSVNDTVNLEVECINRGMFLLTQAILKPQTPLIVGQRYHLIIKNQKGQNMRAPSFYREELDGYENASWMVIEHLDNEAPYFLSFPVLSESKTLHHGCGPEVYAQFECSIQDDSEVLVKTEFKEFDNKETVVYYLISRGRKQIYIGHGMCSGAFKYRPEKMYQVRFCLVDLNGNTNSTWTDWITFKSPFKT